MIWYVLIIIGFACGVWAAIGVYALSKSFDTTLDTINLLKNRMEDKFDDGH